MDFTVIGGMNLDILGMPGGQYRERDSNIGQVITRPGGVGRNIAAQLKKLGARVRLVTALGKGANGAYLENACRDAGIDLSLAVTTTMPAPVYLAIHDDQGDMAAAVNDMRAMEALTAEALAARMNAINESALCVLDANLPIEALDGVAQAAKIPLMLDPVSCEKAKRALPILNCLKAVKPNRIEAKALTGCDAPEDAAAWLLDRGVEMVYISLGDRGVYYADCQSAGYMPAIPLTRRPMTGAGDAMCAGIALAIAGGAGAKECAEAGVNAAYRRLSDLGRV